MKKIIVIGSTNKDLIANVDHLPLPGETVGNAEYAQANGGKGANQAVAAARLGGNVVFVTSTGNDSNGNEMKKDFLSDGIDLSLAKISDKPTGTALIFVSKDAENCIAVAPGANGDLLPSDMDVLDKVLPDAFCTLLQLETPLETVYRAIEKSAATGVKAVLNPAPMHGKLDERIFPMLYLITPNQTEAEALTGISAKDEEGASKAAAALLAKGVKNVIITLGSKGSLICNHNMCKLVPAFKVTPVDTTAAGDTYNGGLVTALAEGKSLEEAAVFAAKAAGISVTRRGAQSSVPYRREL